MFILITAMISVGVICIGLSAFAWKRRSQVRGLQQVHSDAIVRWVKLQDLKHYALMITDTHIKLVTLAGRPSEQWQRSAVSGATIEKLGPSVPTRTALVVHLSPEFGHSVDLPMFFPTADGFLNSAKSAHEIQAVLLNRAEAANDTPSASTQTLVRWPTSRARSSRAMWTVAILSLAIEIGGFVVIGVGDPRIGSALCCIGVFGAFGAAQVDQRRSRR